MAIIVALRKILNSKAIMFSLLFGMLLSAALVALVPTYSSMSLNRTFVKELENFQEETGIYPGMVLVSGFYNENGILDVLRELELTKVPALSDERVRQYLDQRRRSVESTQRFVSDVSGRLGITPEVQIDNLVSMAMVFNIETNRGINRSHGILQSLTGLNSYGSLLRGRYPEEPSNGIFEAMATESSLQSFGIEVGDTITASPRLDESHTSIQIKVVGTFDVNPEHPLAWNFFKPSMFNDSLMLRPEDVDGLFMGALSLVASMRSYQAYDYLRLLDIGIKPLLSMKNDLSRSLYTHGANVDIPMLGRTAVMLQQESSLRSTMWMLNIPVLIMLLLYIVMLVGMLVDNDTGEIALLASRGGTQRFIFIIYFVLGMVLALAAYLLCLPLSLFLAKALSSVNGFLSFVYRRISQVNLGKESYLLAVLALTIAVLMLAVPAALKQRSLNIQFRRLNGRDQHRPFWFRFGLDILMLSASIVGWLLLRTRPEWLSASSGAINPMVFALMPCFIVSATLFFLRLYPLIVWLIYAIIRRWLRAGPYLTLLRIIRSSADYHYIMVFLALTIAIGIFSASAARTLNDNGSDRLAYTMGADVVLSTNWPRQGVQNAGLSYESVSASQGELPAINTRRYQEPLFAPYGELEGVRSAARVFQREAVQVSGIRSAGNVRLMGIDPADFGRTAWYREGLFPVHFHHYLNAIAYDERNIIVSSSLSKRLNIDLGDWVTIHWQGSDSANFRIAAIVNYWPGWENTGRDLMEDTQMLVIADLNAIASLLAVEPYSVWLKMEPGASLSALYDDMVSKQIRPTSIKSYQQENIILVNSANRIAVNGTMSLGFIASCMISALGLILYWQMYLRKNQLQIGLQRSMGFTAGQLLRMLSLEMMLTSIVALVFGSFIGIIGSWMYVPLFELSDSVAGILPFRVRILVADRLTIYMIMGAILLFCWLYVAIKIRLMKVTQAIKLGDA